MSLCLGSEMRKQLGPRLRRCGGRTLLEACRLYWYVTQKVEFLVEEILSKRS